METEKLKVIKKLTLNMKKGSKKGNDQQTENLKTFLKTGKGPKNDETYRKKGKIKIKEN